MYRIIILCVFRVREITTQYFSNFFLILIIPMINIEYKHIYVIHSDNDIG